MLACDPVNPFIFLRVGFLISTMGLRNPSFCAMMRIGEDVLCKP